MASIKKYIFDFVILFIGVTAAFYAENFRQDLSDKQDLNKYLQGLIDDLKSDSLIYVATETKLVNSIQSIDSLILFGGDNKITKSTKLRLLATSTLLIYDVGVDNNVNYKALVNSGQLKLISDIDFRKHLKDYYRNTEVWLKNYESEFQAFRTTELFPFLNNRIDFGDFDWRRGLKISSDAKTEAKIFDSKQFRNYLYRTRQFLRDFRYTMDELQSANDDVLKRTRIKLE